MFLGYIFVTRECWGFVGFVVFVGGCLGYIFVTCEQMARYDVGVCTFVGL